MKTAVSYTLAIETSCDDTGMALVDDDGKVVFNKLLSSERSHRAFGGVVPEIAARAHELTVPMLYQELLEFVKGKADAIRQIAYTATPGLPGSLHTGKVAAKLLSREFKKPLIPINHLHGHIFSSLIEHRVTFPFLACIVSGGHTAIYRVDSPAAIVLLEATRDDAVGEVFDKVGRFLGFEYPAGAALDALYLRGSASQIKLNIHPPRAEIISFSGIKTAAVNFINSCKHIDEKLKQAVASAIQDWAIFALIQTCHKYQALHSDCMTIVFGGGVACNTLLRQQAAEKLRNPCFPVPALCTDNAAMIAYTALLQVPR